MKKVARKPREYVSIKSPDFVAILTIVTEMVRQLNENISKVHLKPLDSALIESVSGRQSETSIA